MTDSLPVSSPRPREHSIARVNEIVGIDPGVSDCGVFCLSPGGAMTRYVIVKSSPPKVKTLFEARAYAVAKKIFDFIHEVPGVKVLGVEGPSYGSKSASMEQMAYCRMALYCMAGFFLPDFFYYPVAPMTAKKVASGSGKGTKEDVAQAVSARFDIDIKSFAISDAAAIAMTAHGMWSTAIEEAYELERQARVVSPPLVPRRRPG